MEKRDELYALLKKKEYPEPFCREVAYKYLNTDYTAGRMMSYLGRENKPNIEMLVDEMFAIISDRDSLVKKHEAEQAQAVINEIYRNGL